MEHFAQILPDGGISAGYVLAGVMSIAMFLFWNTINGMRSDIKEIKKDVEDLKSNDKARAIRLDNVEARALEASRANKELLDEMNEKLDVIRKLRKL